MLRSLLVLVLGAAAGIAVDRVVFSSEPAADLAGAPDREPRAGEPPLIWVDGTIEELDASHLEVREGEGQSLRLRRLAAGETTFLRSDGESWRELPADNAEGFGAGEDACIETLLHGRTLVALRVFLGTRCAPADLT